MTTTRKAINVSITCEDCSGTFDSIAAFNVHSCYVVQVGGRCEDYPACGHTDGDGCQTRPEHTAAYWTERLLDLEAQGYDPHEIDMMFSDH